MTTIEISAAQSCARTLNLGIRGENARTEVCFDFSAWAEEFDAPGAVELYVRRYGETTAYPVVLAIDGSEAVWTVSAIDTHNVGLGEAEFVYLIDSTVVKSVVFGTVVQPDIGRPASDPPEPYESWMEELGEMAAGTLINAQRAEAAQTAAETAQGKAEAAQTSAERAQELAETAKSYADADAANAYAYASNAYDYAQTASSAKTAAEYAQGQAEAARATASNYAGVAIDKATVASNSATAAGNAKTAAQTAQGKAEAAQTAAETAQGKAEAAQTAAELAQGFAEQAKDSALGAAASADLDSGHAYEYMQTASSSATAASGSAAAAAADALKAEGWAVGKQNGVDVGSGSPYYHTNAQYSADQAAGSATAAGESATAAAASAAAAETSVMGGNFAGTYSTSANYAVGDYVLYNSQLYRCTTAISTAEAWTAAHWTAVKVGTELTVLKSAFDAVAYYHTTAASAFYWRPGFRINSGFRYGASETYCALYIDAQNSFPPFYVHVYKGSSFTVAAGYTADYALYSLDNATSTRLASKRNIAAGTTITLTHDGYLLLAVSDGTTEITTDAAATACATAGLVLDLITDTVRDYADKTVTLDAAATLYSAGLDALNKHIIWAENIVTNEGAVSGKLNDDETISASDAYWTSVYFPIKPSTTYINRQSSVFVHVYDYSKKPVTIFQPGASGTFTTPSDAVFARLTSNSARANWQINEGDTLLDFSAGKLPIMTSDELGDSSPFYKGELTTSRANLSGWYEVINTDYSTHSFGYSTTYADIIELFDALVTAGNGYVTKNNIGSGEGTDSGGNTYTMYEYTFKPRNKTTRASRKPPKILLGGSIHGFEKNSTYALYCLMYDIVHNWDKNPVLAELRNHVEIQVTPVCNPWGFDNDVRNNVNGVNLNRNFPSNNWELVTEGINCSGITGPLDQAETQALDGWMKANPDMLIYLDIHTNGHYFVPSYAEANYSKLSSDNTDSYYVRLFDAMCRHIEDQTAFLPTEIEALAPTENQFIGIINTESDAYDDDTGTITNFIPGKIKQYVSAYLKMALCFTVELFNGLKSNDVQVLGMYSSDTLKAGAEILGDTIIKILREYSD